MGYPDYFLMILHSKINELMYLLGDDVPPRIELRISRHPEHGLTLPFGIYDRLSAAAEMETKTRNSHSPMKRLPRQARAVEKVEFTLTAAGRILEKEGLAGLTTNRVAELAGISIGTLYQYFPNKEAIIQALLERERQRLIEAIFGTMSANPSGPADQRTRMLVQILLAAYFGDAGAHCLPMLHMAGAGDAAASFRQLREDLQARMLSHPVVAHDGSQIQLSDTEAFMLVESVGGVLRGLAQKMEKQVSIDRQATEEELVALIHSIMTRVLLSRNADRGKAAG